MIKLVSFLQAILFLLVLLLSFQPYRCTTAEEKNEDKSAQISFLPVKVVKETADANWDVNTLDFSAISERLLQQRAGVQGSNSNDKNISTAAAAAPFPGPDLLEPLLRQCFLYDDQQQYIFRVCPFANVTQHEKSPYAFNFLTTSFHAVLGVYRRWYVALDDQEEGGGGGGGEGETSNSTKSASATATKTRSASFDSLLYLEGDQCEQGVARQVRLHLLCSTDWTMLDLAYLVNVSEVARCRYQATLASPLFCQLGTVQSRLDRAGQSEWTLLEALHRQGLITRAGHEHYLEALLNRYGLTARKDKEDLLLLLLKDSQVENQQSSMIGGGNSSQVQHDLRSCEQRVQQLEREVAELKVALLNSNHYQNKTHNCTEAVC